MKTGREFLNEHIEETNIPPEHWEIEIGEMMDWYADYYHQHKSKEGQRELNNVLGYLKAMSFDKPELENTLAYPIRILNDLTTPVIVEERESTCINCLKPKRMKNNTLQLLCECDL